MGRVKLSSEQGDKTNLEIMSGRFVVSKADDWGPEPDKNEVDDKTKIELVVEDDGSGKCNF